MVTKPQTGKNMPFLTAPDFSIVSIIFGVFWENFPHTVVSTGSTTEAHTSVRCLSLLKAPRIAQISRNCQDVPLLRYACNEMVGENHYYLSVGNYFAITDILAKMIQTSVTGFDDASALLWLSTIIEFNC